MAHRIRTDGDLPVWRLRRVTAYIDENLHRGLQLAELSAVVHMSPFHFARLFKRSTAVPPHRFVVRRRIQQARVLLATETMTVAEIARAVGFRTPSHFTTTFRRMTGMTPTECRSAGSTRPDSFLIPDRSRVDTAPVPTMDGR